MDGGFLSSDACTAAIAGEPLPIHASSYLHRPPRRSPFETLEAECAAAIAAPGALVRIKGPWRTGKTSLMQRLLNQARQLDYAVAVCDLGPLIAADSEPDLDRFLYAFCGQITQALGLPDQLDDYWDDLFGSAIGCKSYFEEYLLPTLNCPLLLTLDDIDSLFPYPQLADEFFGLLRAWHEEAKTRDLWQRLRLAVAHSAEVYIPLNLNKSPFNVGLPVDLPGFGPDEIMRLAGVYDLEISPADGEALMELVGGWPHLVQVGLHHMASHQLSAAALAAAVATQPGPFADALNWLAAIIALDPQLSDAVYKVMRCDRPVDIAQPLALKLQSLGIVRLQNHSAFCSCGLYRTHLAKGLA